MASSDGAAVEIDSVDAWNATVHSTSKPAALLIHAPWHSPSQQVFDILPHLAQDFPDVQISYLDLAKNKSILKEIKVAINVAPTLLFIKDGKICGKYTGSKIPQIVHAVKFWVELKQLPDDVACEAINLSDPNKSSDNNFNEKLNEVLAQEDVILFIKGTMSHPKCETSQIAVSILSQAGIKFGTFNVLADAVIRDGLKVTYNWNNFPFLFVKGKYFVGLAEMLAMKEAGTLAVAFPENCHCLVADDVSNMDLKKLVSRHPVMLFMKGTPNAPQCKYSRQMIEILDGAKISYGTFNILEDPKVRMDLKEFSEWPTYPQLYAGGSLIGGLDVVIETVQEYGSDGLKSVIEESCLTALSSKSPQLAK